MQACWEKSPGERLHFAQIVEYLAHYLEHVNNRRDSYYSEDEEDPEAGDDPLNRKNSRPSRTSSVRSGQKYDIVILILIPILCLSSLFLFHFPTLNSILFRIPYFSFSFQFATLNFIPISHILIPILFEFIVPVSLHPHSRSCRSHAPGQRR